MIMIRILILSACAAAGCVSPNPETTMKLQLETTTTREKGATLVTASLRNGGTESVHVLIEFMLSRTSAKLTDDRGNELPARNAGAMRGARAFQVGTIKPRPLAPGAAVEIEQFLLEPSLNRASAGDLSLDLKDVRSGTLTLEMSYEVTDEAAATARHCKAPDVVVGRWTSKPVTLRFRS